MTPTTLTRRIATSFAGIAIASVLGACGGVTFAGRVVSGPATIATVVPATDPRLSNDTGVGGITVELLDDKENPYGSGVSAPNGTFSISVPTTSAPTRAAIVRATGPGISSGETLLYLPRDGSRVLVNVRKDPRSTVSGSSGT